MAAAQPPAAARAQMATLQAHIMATSSVLASVPVAKRAEAYRHALITANLRPPDWQAGAADGDPSTWPAAACAAASRAPLAGQPAGAWYAHAVGPNGAAAPFWTDAAAAFSAAVGAAAGQAFAPAPAAPPSSGRRFVLSEDVRVVAPLEGGGARRLLEAIAYPPAAPGRRRRRRRQRRRRRWRRRRRRRRSRRRRSRGRTGLRSARGTARRRRRR